MPTDSLWCSNVQSVARNSVYEWVFLNCANARKTRILMRMRMRMDVVRSSSLRMSSIINKSCL